MASAATADAIYVLGGFDAARASNRSVFVYQAGRGAWSRGPDLPLPLDHPAAATLDGAVYVAGGYSNGPASARTFRLAGEGWQEVAPLHHPRGALALVNAAGHLYAIGGAAGPEIAAVEEYEPGGNAWTDVSLLPQPRDHLAGFAFQGKACVAGGRFPTSPRIDCYDPAAHTWSRLPDLPEPTSGAGAGAVAGEVVVVGGEDATEGRLVATVQRLRDGSWTADPMLFPRHGVQLAAWEGGLLACGGADQAAYHAVSRCTLIGP